MLGLLYFNRGEFESAIAEYDTTIELAPDYAVPYYNRALSYDQQGNVGDALDNYKRFLELSPTEDDFTSEARKRVEMLGGAEPLR